MSIFNSVLSKHANHKDVIEFLSHYELTAGIDEGSIDIHLYEEKISNNTAKRSKDKYSNRVWYLSLSVLALGFLLSLWGTAYMHNEANANSEASEMPQFGSSGSISAISELGGNSVLWNDISLANIETYPLVNEGLAVFLAFNSSISVPSIIEQTSSLIRLELPANSVMHPLNISMSDNNIVNSFKFIEKNSGVELLIYLNQPSTLNWLKTDESSHHTLKIYPLNKNNSNDSPLNMVSVVENNSASKEIDAWLKPELPPLAIPPSSPIFVKEEISSEDMFISVKQLVERGDIKSAIEMTEKLLDREPEYSDVRLLIAEALSKAGLDSKAEQYLAEGMSIDAYNIDLRMARAKLWAKRDYIKEALIHMSDISPAMSKEADFYGLKAMLLLKDNQASKAEGLYEQLVEVEPEYTPWRLGWAMSLEQLDEYEKAQSLYNDLLAIENDPTRYYFVQNRLAVVEKKLDKDDSRNE